MPNTAEAAAFLPAIEALRLDLISLEHRAADVRALLERLCAHAGIAGEPAAAAKLLGVDEGTIRNDVRKDSAKSAEKSRTTRTGSAATKARRANVAAAAGEHPSKEKPTAAKPDLAQSVADWLQALTSRSAAVVAAQNAARAKDEAKLRAAVNERCQIDRRLGELLAVIGGRARPLPGGTQRTTRERWVALARMPTADFQKTAETATRRALGEIGIKSPPRKRKKRIQPRSPPKPSMRLSDWQQSADGSLSRTLTGVDADGAGALET